MLSKKTELVAATLVLVVLAGVPVWIIFTESIFASVSGVENPRVMTLTAVAKGGIWTEDEVVGHSYWRRQPKPTERLVLRLGETFVIRFKSADVNHSFAIPNLNVGPVSIEPGHVSELWFVPVERAEDGWNVHVVTEGHVSDVRFMPMQPGEYLTQCSAWCGSCHEEMRGTFVVLGAGQTLEDYPGGMLPPRKKCPLHSGEQK